MQPAHAYAPSLGYFVPCAFLSSCSSSPGFASEKPAGSVAFSRSTANWFGESSARQPSSDVGIAPEVASRDSARARGPAGANARTPPISISPTTLADMS